jgi:nicotine blue oxidoreductase
VLAAGRGSRLGLGPKAFVHLDGEALLVRAVERLRRFGVAPIVAVLPPGPDPIALPSELIVVRNYDVDTGQLGSTCLGLDGLSTDLDAVIVYPVDHYAVTDADLATLFEARALISAECARIVPRWSGRGGHPVMLLPPALQALRAVADPGATTLRHVLEGAGATHDVKALTGGVRQNLNTPADLPTGVGSLASEPQ